MASVVCIVLLVVRGMMALIVRSVRRVMRGVSVSVLLGACCSYHELLWLLRLVVIGCVVIVVSVRVVVMGVVGVLVLCRCCCYC